MAEGKPTLHHLNNSQSQVILWLLEELEIPYDLELYKRVETGNDRGRAPDSLKKIHPNGKSPTLVTAEGRAIIERSAIALYLISAYDKAKRFQADDAIREEELISFGGTSLNPIMMVIHLLDLVNHRMPFFIKPLTASTYQLLTRAFLWKEIASQFSYLEQEIGDRDYFMGNHPTRADFMLFWNIDFCSALKYINLKDYPKLLKFWERCRAREGWKRAMEKGNGYDMASVL